jgi:predicted dehydrogenase
MDKTMDSYVRLGLVGTGAIAKAYAEALTGSETAILVAACDTNVEAVRSFSSATGCTTYASFDEMVARETLDGVIICTPPATHESIALAAMARRLHVLCEKPLTIDVPSARRLIKASLNHHVLLTMASKFRFVNDVRNAREILASGAIGDLVLIENAFTSRVEMGRRWNSNPAMSGGGVLIDNGTHAVDLLRFFMGQLCDIQIFEGRRVQSVAVEDTVRLFVRNRNSAIGTSDLSWSINKELDTFLRIYGSEGTILVGWKESKYKRFDSNEWTVFGNGYDKVSAFRRQIDNFSDAIRGQGAIELSLADALASVEVIASAYEALSVSRWHRVGAPLEELSNNLAGLEAVR